MNEPQITINGWQLTDYQANAIRVSVESFVSDLTKNGLGDDEAGKALTSSYLDDFRHIQILIRLDAQGVV